MTATERWIGYPTPGRLLRDLRPGDRIRVRMALARTARTRLAIVTGDRPSAIGPWILVTFAYVLHDTGPGIETIGRLEHVAQAPLDRIELVR